MDTPITLALRGDRVPVVLKRIRQFLNALSRRTLTSVSYICSDSLCTEPRHRFPRR
jgi:hypothetical protein